MQQQNESIETIIQYYIQIYNIKSGSENTC